MKSVRAINFAVALGLAIAMSSSASAAFLNIDDFESYAAGDAISSKAGWNNNGSVATDPAGGSNLVLAFSPSNGTGYYYDGSDITIDNGSTATLFFRARMTSGGVGGQAFGMGMSDKNSPNLWRDFEAQLTWDETGDPLSVRNGPSPSAEADAWYNIWMVIDNDIDVYDVHFQSDDDLTYSTMTRVADDAGFRNGLDNNDLVSFFLRSNSGAGGVLYIDDIYLDDEGENLQSPIAGSDPPSPDVIPEPATMSLLGLGGAMLLFRRRRADA